MASNAVSTAGMLVKYAVEATAGTRPTSGYTTIPGVKAIPAIFNDPNMLQSTPLSATKNHTYIEGLNDSGGSIQLTVNDYDAFRTAWTACVAAFDELTGGKTMWFEIAYQDGSNLESFYFPAQPLKLGFGGADVDAVLENNLNLAPQGDYEFAAAST
jgi:hypothetical protein